jgi:hypothetical protein
LGSGATESHGGLALGLVIDSAGIQKRKKREVWDRTKQLADAAVKRDWDNNFVTHAPDGNRPTTTLEAQMGRPLNRLQFEQRLKLCNSNLFTETSTAFPDKAGIYTVMDLPDELGVLRKQKKFVTGIMNGFMPEFSVRHVEYEDVPNPASPGEMTRREKFIGETRGWRTAVATLLRSGLLTYESVQKNFETQKGQESRNWKLLTT